MADRFRVEPFRSLGPGRYRVAVGRAGVLDRGGDRRVPRGSGQRGLALDHSAPFVAASAVVLAQKSLDHDALESARRSSSERLRRQFFEQLCGCVVSCCLSHPARILLPGARSWRAPCASCSGPSVDPRAGGAAVQLAGGAVPRRFILACGAARPSSPKVPRGAGSSSFAGASLAIRRCPLVSPPRGPGGPPSSRSVRPGVSGEAGFVPHPPGPLLSFGLVEHASFDLRVVRHEQRVVFGLGHVLGACHDDVHRRRSPRRCTSRPMRAGATGIGPAPGSTSCNSWPIRPT